MEPLLVSNIQIFQEKILGKKWKPFVAAFFEESQLGKSRMELYQSQAKLKLLDVSKTILLDQTVSLKPGKTDAGVSFVKIQFKDDSNVQLSCEELPRILDVLSTICFPKKYVTIAPSTSLNSPSVEDEEEFFEFPVSYPMLKLKQTNGRESSDGFFNLEFSNSLHISGPDTDRCIPYSALIWIATGEHCLGVDIENVGILEFATGDAMTFVEHLRGFVRFSCNFSSPNRKTICRFNRYYHPLRQANSTSPGISNNSTMESVDSGGVYTKILTSGDTSVSSLQLTEPEFVNKVVKNELRRNASAEMLRHKISFLQKKKNEARTDFEENAETDFVRLELPKTILNEQNRSPSNKSVSFQDSDPPKEEVKQVPRQTDL